jgi:glutaredoxin
MIMSVILHSTHCPKCNVLETKLKQKNIAYEENNNVELMTQKGIVTVPVLEVNGTAYSFKEAIEWIGEQ